MKKITAELFGTFWLVFGGCGSALLAAGIPGLGIGYAGVALAFGLTVLTLAYGLGHISGAHFNPAVTIGLWVAGRHKGSEVIPYIIAQVVGATIAAAALYFIWTGNISNDVTALTKNGFASNGYGDHSPHGYTLISALLIEAILTFGFLIVIIGSTDERAPKGFAGIAIGLALTLIHLISIPVTNTSVNPARSTSQAIFLAVGGGGTWALSQLWAFWVAPIVGAILAGAVYKGCWKKSE
ncbi:MAG: aquaporin Z [Chitinophagaceae bacterium]|jgi:aquaporin Z|nr:aquaporin Z [Chitinophagaceae bacterium]